MISLPAEHTLSAPISNRTQRLFCKMPIHPRRILSQFLIALLLLLSPITFSTDKITNFVYECPISSTCTLKTRRSVVNLRSEVVQTGRTSANLANHGLPVTPLPPAVPVCFTSPCRAPPA
ncbi:MAG: hypothetical protein RW306_19690 [Geobacteraceae bacterium]|nr:hypothetical protein [Geobacteraceae bacterium]